MRGMAFVPGWLGCPARWNSPFRSTSRDQSSIMRACRHSGERLQSASMAKSFCRVSHLRPASRLKCWWSRKPRDRRRPGPKAFEIRFSSSVSRLSRLPARTGTPYCDSAGHPHFGFGGFLNRIGCNRGIVNFSNLALTASSALASSPVGKSRNSWSTEG